MSHIPCISVHYSCWIAFEICSLISNECMLTKVSSFRKFYILSLATKTLCFELFKTLRVIENSLLVIENGHFEIYSFS